jgi:NitT/TauT family transport system substrate-binding protein
MQPIRSVLSTLKAAVLGASLMASGAALAPAQAEQISVTHWGALMYGIPYAVAMDKGFFKEAGVDITGILTSKGGGTTMRNVLAGGLPYGEVAIAAVVAAQKEGIDVKIVNLGVRTVADLVWVTMPDSPLKTPQDLVGKKIAYTSPKSVTEMLTILMLTGQKIDLDKVTRVSLGGIGAGLTAMEKGAVDAAPITEPLLTRQASRYRTYIASKDVLPPIAQTVGVTTSEFAKSNGDKLKAIIAGRRKGVEYVKANPKESAELAAKYYNLPAELMEQAIKNMITVDYWSTGKFEIDAMNNMAEGLRVIGELQGPVDWDKLIDRSFLPQDLAG